MNNILKEPTSHESLEPTRFDRDTTEILKSSPKK